jgi:[protein-PII] uridylyltransferase
MEPEETTEVATLVRRHLLLADTATRRDLDDGAVIASTAEVVQDPRLLRLLYVLTVADGRATGPFAWNDWKAALVRELYRKTLMALEKGEIPTRSDVAARSREVEAYEPTLAGRAEEILATLPPSYLDSTSIPDMVDEVRMLLDPPGPGQIRVRFEPGTEPDQTALIACVPDRPGALARTAGTLSLNRVPILRAQAFSTTTGIALQRLIVDIDDATRSKVEADLAAVYSGRLALEAELERKARIYNAPSGVEPEVRILQDASPHSTVIEVRSPDAVGLLFAIAAAVGELDLDIHVAKIDTLGHRVVDVFYVRTPWGDKLSPEQGSAVDAAIRHRIARLLA